ncbi:hypothetical protein [Massilia sp. TS11]|uniref:hypothetical protein n=1 Tax=Massilia sp. TS11 TaxID=2908003 RepID=UPI001EDC3C13|nr:hypothetical protein [Massilia sp. TS11]MCG2585834.1 hypothetical protein [Massilia sp. TS11]
MDAANKLLNAILNIHDSQTQLFVLATGSLAIAGLALYVVLLAIKHGGKRE